MNASMAELYRKHRPLLISIGCRLVGREHAEDLVHDVIIEAWRRADSFDPSRGTVRNWLAVRVHCRAIDQMRARVRRERKHARLTEVPRPPPSLVDDAPVAFERHRLQAALGRLNESQRRVLELHFFRELSFPEIARELDVPLGTVKSRIARGI